ncbi:transaldolase [Puteibacter caeruleilacunae]|nr:transaldolase [Puteibacter caeruleilacunae]
MDDTLKRQIREFISTDLTETPIITQEDTFWQKLKRVGTELWLDTGDMEEAEKNWTAEMTALTTNNTLINKEIQKGIYDEFIAKAQTIVSDLPINDQIIEIAFILNARHGLRLAKRFGGYVSVELHTNTAHNFDAIIDYGLRYHEICPEQFIVKVPYTAAGLLGARKLRELGVKINFTLEFSARQNVMVAAIAQPDYLNVFLGRLGAYMKDNNLGDSKGVGERAVLSTQNWLNKLKGQLGSNTKLIAASLRSESQLEALAGTDVYTMPIKVAHQGKETLSGDFQNQLKTVYDIDLNENANGCSVEKLWEVSKKELMLAMDLNKNLPKNGSELIDRVHQADCRDMFPYLSENDYRFIAEDGKIPPHERWSERIKYGDIAIDTLLNLAGLASFTADQAQLDDRIRNIIS